ncbi:hypothetical protein DXN05_22980 [Deminuibacter soli]|uniref:Uncharacterized protein n=2 Tax=Deminuibacter soli TaxID=2291815 RepID=A0A3E1ND95_9BACT|nr:hypothetical protein DXN05_22980 [Deminuibacter soli]
MASQCDGDWEHEYGIKTETTDNPGWSVTIDLADTAWENLEFDWILIEIDDNNWYGYKVKNKKFFGTGDLNKLELLLEKFKELIENNDRMPGFNK